MQNFCPTIQQLSNALHSPSFILPSSLYLCVFLALPTLLSPSFLGLHAASRLKVIRPGWQFFPWPSCENFLPCRTFIELIFLFAFAQLYRFRSLVLWLELKEPSEAKPSLETGNYTRPLGKYVSGVWQLAELCDLKRCSSSARDFSQSFSTSVLYFYDRP